ncbi:hypothetical protein BX600DRAFT_439047 [Xylariales sp. PMI_506]|nr:hypothetical protein BX600DRAFT_439047 [Xylariales sp. PMI_506]
MSRQYPPNRHQYAKRYPTMTPPPPPQMEILVLVPLSDGKYHMSTLPIKSDAAISDLGEALRKLVKAQVPKPGYILKKVKFRTIVVKIANLTYSGSRRNNGYRITHARQHEKLTRAFHSPEDFTLDPMDEVLCADPYFLMGGKLSPTALVLSWETDEASIAMARTSAILAAQIVGTIVAAVI